MKRSTKSVAGRIEAAQAPERTAEHPPAIAPGGPEALTDNDSESRIISVQGSFLDVDQVWRQLIGTRKSQPRSPALFLDRDGVIVEEVNYLHRIADLALIPGASETIAAANRRGVPVVIVTNQAGIARGYFGWKEFQEVQDAMLAELGRHGATVDAVFACPHHPDGLGPYAHPDHPARKPRPGMLLGAAKALDIDLERSWIVGDQAIDLMAGRAAGLRGGLLVLTGHGPSELAAATALRSTEFEVLVAPSIADATRLAGLFA